MNGQRITGTLYAWTDITAEYDKMENDYDYGQRNNASKMLSGKGANRKCKSHFC